MFKTRNQSKGAAAVEFAIILPLLFLFVFGIIEFGRALMVHQVLVNSAREATRRAVVPGSTDGEVNTVVTNYMNSAGITGYSHSIKVNGTAASLSTANSGDSIIVTVSVPNSSVSWGIFGLIDQNRQFSVAVNMRKE